MIRSLLGRQAPKPQGETVRILLVDDDEEEAMITRSLLERAEDVTYTMDWAATYESGAAAIARGEHRAYLVDQSLGGATGIELIREARAAGSHAPLVMMTGQRDRATDLAALAAGATDFLIKGKTDGALLDRTLRYAITHAEMVAELEIANRRISGLDAIGRLLFEDGPTSAALEGVVAILSQQLGFGHVAIYLANDATLDLAAHAGYEYPRPTISAGDSVVERLTRARQPLIVPNITDQPGDQTTALPVELAVPLMMRDQLVGLLNCRSSATASIGAYDHALLRIIGERITTAIAVALERAQLDARTRSVRDEPAPDGPQESSHPLRDPVTGLYSAEFLAAYVAQLGGSITAGAPALDVSVALIGAADEDHPAVEEITAALAQRFPAQLMARDGASDVALVVISGGTADVAEQLREMCAASVERARPLAAGVAVLRAVGDASALLPQAGAALAIARRVGPGTVIS